MDIRRQWVLAALVVTVSTAATAQQMYKCTNPAGKVTYSSTACAELGLKDAGPVRDSLQVTPAYRPPTPAPAAKAAEAAKPAAAPAAPAKAAEPAQGNEADDPDKRCFKTKSGIRCNDKPDEKPG